MLSPASLLKLPNNLTLSVPSCPKKMPFLTVKSVFGLPMMLIFQWMPRRRSPSLRAVDMQNWKIDDVTRATKTVQVLIKFLDDFQDLLFFSYLYSVLYSEFINDLSVVVSFFKVEKVFSRFFSFFCPATFRSKRCSLSFAIIYWMKLCL